MLLNIVMVGLGGALGAVSRFFIRVSMEDSSSLPPPSTDVLPVFFFKCLRDEKKVT